ncbi:MAG: phosphatidylserine/phosphatidylglycerophosphate/cardiolipin synthase family protein [Anaerolineales bacterium]|nr:phosphatidylserine/phosphatidylglycerophosphate/cardiolipin synthase family protein [Anaerolineales bacterium]
MYAQMLAALAAKPQLTYADTAIEFPPTWAQNIQLMVEGETFFRAIGDAILAANHSVHIIQFGYKAGTVGFGFSELLEEKARAGVPVRLIVDRLGSAFRLKRVRTMYDELVAAGVQVVVNDPLSLWPQEGLLGTQRTRRSTAGGFARADHRKLFVIDGQTAFVGGAGIEDHFYNGEFHDVYVRCQGELVHQLQLLFLASFLRRGGPLPQAETDLASFFSDDTPDTQAGDHPLPAVAERIPARVRQNVPGAKGSTRAHVASQGAFEQVANATQSLDIMNPYITDHKMIHALIAAAQRGVKVRLVVPGKPNNVACAAAMHHFYPAMLGAGIEIWEYPAVVHAKVLVRDGETVQVGTLNYDALSLRNNPEIELQFESPQLATIFAQELFANDIAKCQPGVASSGAMKRVWNAGMSLLSPLL